MKKRFNLCGTKFSQYAVRFTKYLTSVRLNSTGLISESRFALSRKFYLRTDENLAGFTCVKKQKQKGSNGGEPREKKKLIVVHLFTFTHGVHMSLLILFTYVKPAKFTSLRT